MSLVEIQAWEVPAAAVNFSTVAGEQQTTGLNQVEQGQQVQEQKQAPETGRVLGPTSFHSWISEPQQHLCAESV